MCNYRYSKGSCLLAAVVILLVIVAIVAGALLYVFNSTANVVGLGNIPLNDSYTVNTVGLGDIKISELWKVAKSLAKGAYTPDNEGLPSDSDKQKADSATENWFLPSINGNDNMRNYEMLFVPTVLPRATALNQYTFSERQLAYMFNTALSQFYVDSKVVTDAAESLGNSTLNDIVGIVEVLRTLKVSIEKLHFETSSENATMVVGISVDISTYLAGITIPFVQISDIVYADLSMSLDDYTDNGKLEGKFASVSVNGNDTYISLAVLDSLFKLIAESGSEPLTTEQICGYATDVISYLCQRIGLISNIDFVQGDIVFGK